METRGTVVATTFPLTVWVCNYNFNKTFVAGSDVRYFETECVCPFRSSKRRSLISVPIKIVCNYTVSQKKTSHFNFRHNFAICWDIFTIFEAPCSGLIAGWRTLLHTHHRCEAFTWRDVTHDVIQDVARSAHWRRISYHLIMASELTGLESCWLFFLEYHVREGVPDTHSEYRRVETSASSGVAGDRPKTYRCSYWTAATPSQCVWLVCESSGGYFDQHLRWIYM